MAKLPWNWFISLQYRRRAHLIRRIKMDIAEVQAKLAALKTSVDALLALPSNPPAVDLQPLGDAVDAIKAEIDAKLPAATPAP